MRSGKQAQEPGSLNKGTDRGSEERKKNHGKYHSCITGETHTVSSEI